jgi:hypothetical protein
MRYAVTMALVGSLCLASGGLLEAQVQQKCGTSFNPTIYCPDFGCQNEGDGTVPACCDSPLPPPPFASYELGPQ